MIPERWDEIQSLFGEVVDLEPGERVERLAVISETDPELYSEVQSLLAAHAQVDDRLGLLEDLASPIGGADVEAVARKQASDPYGLLDRTVSHYRILEALGGGGMGILYKAMDARLDRIVALKFLPPQWSLDAAFKERFEHEARAAAALDHNHVCNIYEIGETREGQLFIAMAYYEGKTVKEELTEGPMEIDEALGLAAQAASGLAAGPTPECGSAPLPTCRPSRPAARRSRPARTSGRWASSCTRCSPAASPSGGTGRGR
jgi:hypothetical protein